MTTFTTGIGFAGVLLAPHEGLRSLARVSLAGILFAFFASVLFLPACLKVYDRFKPSENKP